MATIRTANPSDPCSPHTAPSLRTLPTLTKTKELDEENEAEGGKRTGLSKGLSSGWRASLDFPATCASTGEVLALWTRLDSPDSEHLLVTTL